MRATKLVLYLSLVVLFATAAFTEEQLAAPQTEESAAPSFHTFCMLLSEIEVYAQHLTELGLHHGKMVLLKSHEKVGLEALKSIDAEIEELYLIVYDLKECGTTDILRYSTAD